MHSNSKRDALKEQAEIFGENCIYNAKLIAKTERRKRKIIWITVFVMLAIVGLIYAWMRA